MTSLLCCLSLGGQRSAGGVETQTVVIESAQCSCSSSEWSGSIRAGGKLYSIVAIHHNPTPVAIKRSGAIEYLHSHLIAPLSPRDKMVIATIWIHLKLSFPDQISIGYVFCESLRESALFSFRFCCIYWSGQCVSACQGRAETWLVQGHSGASVSHLRDTSLKYTVISSVVSKLDYAG